MRVLARTLVVCGASCVPLACGGAAQQPTQTPVAVATAPKTVASEPLPELTTVPEPADVVALARWKTPSGTFATVQQWFGLPVPVNEFIEEVLSVPDGSVVSTEAPVDGLVTLDPQAPKDDPRPLAAFSIGLRSLEEARQALSKKAEVRQLQPGTYGVQLGSGGDRVNCLLGPSLGTASARIVCGERERDAVALFPYLTRGMPVATLSDADVYAEVRLEPVQRRYGEMIPSALQMGSSFVSHELSTGDRSVDRAITDALTGLSEEAVALLGDTDRMQLSFTMDAPNRTASGDLTFVFKSRGSWTAQALFEHADRQGAPPEIFWKAPAGSDSAFYARGTDEARYQRVQAIGADLIRALLTREKLPARDADSVAKLYEGIFMTTGPTVSASGHLEPAPVSESASEFERLSAQLTSALGWQIVGMDSPSTRVDKWLTDLASTYNRPSVQRWLREKADLKATAMPKITYRTQRLGSLGNVKVMEMTVTSALLQEVLSVQAEHAKPAKPFTYWIVLMADGNRTWMGMSADRAALENKLAAVKGSASANTLASRAGLEPLKQMSTLGGGYMTIASLVHQSASSLGDSLHGYRAHRAQQLFDILAKIPQHGETPILLWTNAQEGTPARASIKFQAQRGTIDDLGAIIVQAVGGRR